MTSLSVPKLQKSLLRFGDGQSLLQSILENAMQHAISLVNPVLKHVENSSISHRRRSLPGFILEFVFHPNLKGSADLRCKPFRFWGKLSCEMCRIACAWHTSHKDTLWYITCGRQIRKKDKTRMPFRAEQCKQLRIPGMSWSNKTFQALHKMPKTFPKLELQSKYTDSQFMLTGESVQNCCQVFAKSCFKHLACI